MDALLQQTLSYNDLVDFLENEMYIPETGKPMSLHPEQRAVLRAMSERKDGMFLYSTWLFSMPKKSAKTTIGAGVALWQAWRIPDGEVYIIGNDLKQADNRMAQAIRYCVEHNPRMRQRVKVTTSKYKIELDNGTKIESIPVDPRGEAGMNPTGLFWTEAWGAMGSRAEMLWSEATLSPTRSGQAFKFIESYAGFNGQSLILERLYDSVIKDGAEHPAAQELFTNGSSIGYWCTRRYLDWQQDPEYYRQQALEKTPDEFARQHDNQWASATNAFVPMPWWEACRLEIPPMESNETMVIGIDAGISSDSFGIVGVSRRGDNVYLRYVMEYKPPKGGVIDFREPEAEIRRLAKEFKVSCFTYDPYQLHDFCTRLQREGVGWFRSFAQGNDRLKADKQFYDTIRDRRFLHDGNPTLTQHIANANSKVDGDKLRIIKRQEQLKIDCAVAASMASFTARYLLIG